MWSASHLFHGTFTSPGNQHLIVITAVETWKRNGLRPKVFMS